jgi:hypothetical protein
MSNVTEFTPGGFRYVNGVFQYSCGVAALPGFVIERVRFFRPVPIAQGFAAIESHMRALGRPMTAFCACELRSPEPFSEAGFRAFNEVYVGTLARWGLYRDGINPVARSNVCPEIDPPGEPSFYAFSYTVPALATAAPARASFVIAGSAESPEGKSNYRDHIIRLGDTSPSGLLEKARWVLGEHERRMGELGVGWADTTGVHVYTVHDIHALMAPELMRRGAGASGVNWQFCRPPVVDLEFEMDMRGVDRERVI